MAVFDNEATVRAINPNQALLGQLDVRGVIIVAAPGRDVDFVSRFFAPKFGIPEDPVTGSAHCILAPYWAKRLRKNVSTVKQLSKCGGSITCEVKHGRVLLSGVRLSLWRLKLTSKKLNVVLNRSAVNLRCK
jgi:predicted PhzF superfamily epimerase YddE/YHI9